MQFSIGSLLRWTLIIALLIHTIQVSRRLRTHHNTIAALDANLSLRNFDEPRVRVLTELFENALEETPVPSAALQSAQRNYRRLYPERDF